jgi:hypothetical protein
LEYEPSVKSNLRSIIKRFKLTEVSTQMIKSHIASTFVYCLISHVISILLWVGLKILHSRESKMAFEVNKKRQK